MIALLILMATGLAPPAPPAPAALHCATPAVAQGDIKGGPPLVHVFELTNRTDQTLTITKVETGCGCVTRILSANALKPGATAKLTIEVNTLTQPDGPNRWQAVVNYATDREEGQIGLTITANLSREVTLSPPQIGFSTTGEAKQAITITDRRAKPLTVVKAAASNPHLTAEVAEARKVVVTLSAEMPAGQRDEVLVLQTDDPAYPEFRVPVRISKRAPGAVIAAPEEIQLRLASEGASALVQIRSPDGKNVRIEAADSDSPAVSVKFSSEAGRVATLRITVARVEANSGRVKVRIAEPSAQEIVIPVSWMTGTKK